MWPMVIAAIANGLSNQEKENKARREAQSNISSKFAASMSSDVPQYGLDAQRANNAIDENQDGHQWIQEYMKRQPKKGQ